MKILLIDGNNLAHRTYHAQNLMTTSGQNTGMIYGTVNSMLSLQRELRADKVYMVWDPSGGSEYRKALYPLYKANRDKLTDAFYEELGILRELLSALGVTQITKPGVECDDVIGYLAKHAFPQDTVHILSNDKDLLQLIDDRITVVHPDNGPYKLDEDGRVTFKDQGKVVTILPSQVADYKAMVGDSSDNYPGLPGFGVVSAIKFFSQNRDIDGIFDGTANLLGLRSQALSAIVNGKCMLDIFRQLATINVGIGEVAIPPQPQPNTAKANALFDMLEFKQFIALGPSIYGIGGSRA